MNVKKGDTAIVIESTFPENLGIICEVKEYLGTVRQGDRICFNAWHIVSNGRPFVLNGKSLLECGTADYALRPVSGLTDPESTDNQVPEIVDKPISAEVL